MFFAWSTSKLAVAILFLFAFPDMWDANVHLGLHICWSDKRYNGISASVFIKHGQQLNHSSNKFLQPFNKYKPENVYLWIWSLLWELHSSLNNGKSFSQPTSFVLEVTVLRWSKYLFLPISSLPHLIINLVEFINLPSIFHCHHWHSPLPH